MFEETNDEFEPQSTEPPASISKELFLEWRSPRRGKSNPELQTNPVWEWLIQSRCNAFIANEKFDGPDSFHSGPCWCFERFGQSVTRLNDGREVFIAGEHEDFYDPDFYIYNDVVVKHPDGRCEIFGYPSDIFAPTDFHSATLVGNEIIIIGSLGYVGERRPGFTPVTVLNLDTWAISSRSTSGTMPGWIHAHSAVLSSDHRSILIRGGKVHREDMGALVENIDDWCLNLVNWRWERLTQRNWRRWELRRRDGSNNHLFEFKNAQFEKQFPSFADIQKVQSQFGVPSLADELGGPPDLDLFARLYQPPVSFEPIPDNEEEYNVTRINIDGVIVRYVQDPYSVQITVEGELLTLSVDRLLNDICDKLTALEKSPCELKEL